MEQYLLNEGYNIWDDALSNDRCIDSNSVIQFADELGYEAILNSESTYDFHKVA